MNVLVIGRGSIGKKHLASLRALSGRYALSIRSFEPSSHTSRYYDELEKELVCQETDAAFICNPTSMHARTALICLKAGTHVFLEKPLNAEWDSAMFAQMLRLIRKRKLTFMVGYDMRFHPMLRKVKKLLDAREIGEVWGIRVMAGQYLPDWREGVDYRKIYSAKKSLGGGVLLDLSHEIDYLNWLVPKKIAYVGARNIRTGRLEIETEDVSTIVFEYKDRSVAHVHLDYLTVPYRRSLELYGSTGTILWDDNAHTTRVYTKKSGSWKTIRTPVGKKTGTAIFKEEISHFFDCILNKSEPINSFENAKYVMHLIRKIRKSSGTGKIVAV